jgi:imidazole glycerol-phosphate synthase subunit HisH
VVGVAVLDYGSGNLRSAERALVRAGATAVVTTDRDEAATADGLVVPGVGAYAACMAGLEPYGPMIADRLAAGRPVLGICVGMQVFFEYGDEHGVTTKGLGLLPGGVTRLDAPRVPHIGWNLVKYPANSALFAGADPVDRYYFVHSYAATQSIEDALVTTASHGQTFVAAVEKGPLTVTQFHPEKSGDAGARLLHNWVATLPPSLSC